jgi:hypothetical protein
MAGDVGRVPVSRFINGKQEIEATTATSWLLTGGGAICAREAHGRERCEHIIKHRTRTWLHTLLLLLLLLQLLWRRCCTRCLNPPA